MKNPCDGCKGFWPGCECLQREEYLAIEKKKEQARSKKKMEQMKNKIPRVLVLGNTKKFSEIIKQQNPNEVQLEELMLFCVVAFSENAAELGCPRNKDVDMWIRELPIKKAKKVMSKLIDIIERDYNGQR